MDRTRLTLQQLFPCASFIDCGGVIASRACADSRQIRPGDLFVAIPGTATDGHQLAADAVQQGAVALLVSRPLPGLQVPQCVVPDTRAAWSLLTMAAAGMPQRKLQNAGITGTNGKTTTSWILRSILQASGQQPGLLGTIEYSDGHTHAAAQLTTPDAATLSTWYEQMVRAGSTHCVLEISSHALVQQRCAAVPLSVAAITNVTQDHFDYHGDYETYLAAKAGIRRLLRPEAELWLGMDDAGCRTLQQQFRDDAAVRTFGFDTSADVSVTQMGTSVAGGTTASLEQCLQLELRSGAVQVRTSLVGRHNALNCLAAAAMAESLGISLSCIADGIERLRFVPGRLQPVLQGQAFQVFVDFAHTPDGLKHCLQTLRKMTQARLICIFGAGGNRDRTKRPLMGQAASQADAVIVTSDNPRDESCAQILQDIMPGLATHSAVQWISDRRLAIATGLRLADPGDVVVIAGRGHETMQRVADQDLEFDDVEVASELLRELRQPISPDVCPLSTARLPAMHEFDTRNPAA